uniref:Immunoglobulin domain-containing protein n=1 Tax=Sinocyclocheilus anshuiensis TaxID=1608454 RepID=A0A671NKL3_9TELE
MIFLFSVVAGAPVTVTGHRGHRLDIRCPYESGYGSNSKYFCKGKCNFANIMVKSGSPAKDQRFSLSDDTTARVFTVTITDLRTEDGGQYWCAVNMILTADVYSEILLLVKQDNKTTEVSSTSPFIATPSYFSKTEPNPQSTSSFVIITAGGLVLLLICAVLLTVAVQKKKQACGLVSSSAEGLHLTEKRRKENAYAKGNPAVASNSHTAQSDDVSAVNKFHRAANTEAADTDLDYMNHNSVNPVQIYTELNASRHSHIYQSLTAGSLQEESIYHCIHQSMD